MVFVVGLRYSATFCCEYIACQVMRKRHLRDKNVENIQAYSKYTGNEHAQEYSGC